MRALKLVGLLFLGIAASAPAYAEYPENPITVIVPFPAGGASDTVARVISEKLEASLGQPFIVENRPGANGAIGARSLSQAEPDGHTLLVGSIGVFAINPVLMTNAGYDPRTDWDLLTLAVRTPNVLVVNPEFPADSVAELIDHLKKNPDAVTFASSGVGSSDHLTTELFWQKTGTTGTHVPYKGGAPAITDLIGGQVDASFQNLGSVASHVKAGKLKLLGVTSNERTELFPEAPTMAEAGVEGLEVYSFQAAAGPKGLPANVKSKLETALQAALDAPDVKAKFEEMGFEVVGNTSAEFAEFLPAEMDRWKAVIEAGNITAQQ